MGSVMAWAGILLRPVDIVPRGLFMDAWARAEWLACAYGFGHRFGPGYIWLVGKVVVFSYIGMVVGVIGKYVYYIFFIRAGAK